MTSGAPGRSSSTFTPPPPMDITIQKGDDLPELKQCTDCCNFFHCPFCSPQCFLPTLESKVKVHLKLHFKRAVKHEGYTMHRCGRLCRKVAHYHCLYCETTVLRKYEDASATPSAKKLKETPLRPKSLRSKLRPTFLKKRLVRKKTQKKIVSASSQSKSKKIVVVVDRDTNELNPTTEENGRNGKEDENEIVSIRRGTNMPQLKKCTDCCKYFHCPFCAPKHFRPSIKTRVEAHLKLHYNRAVRYEGYIIHRCCLGCREKPHYHCPYCKSTLMRTEDFMRHIQGCKRKETPDPAVQPPTATENGSDPADATPMKGQKRPKWADSTPIKGLKFAGYTIHRCRLRCRTVPHYHCPYCSCTILRASDFMRHLGVCKSKDPSAPAVESQSAAEDGSDSVNATPIYRRAMQHNVPLSVQLLMGHPVTKKCLSIYEPNISIYSRLRRMIVSYNEIRNKWYCPCSRTKRTCIHKYIGKWHLFHTDRGLFSNNKVQSPSKPRNKRVKRPKDQSASGAKAQSAPRVKAAQVQAQAQVQVQAPAMQSAEAEVESDVEDAPLETIETMEAIESIESMVAAMETNVSTSITYPPKDVQMIRNMVQYLLMNKRLPALLPDHLSVPVDKDYPRHLIPTETNCLYCVDGIVLSQPVLITQKAKILTYSRILQDVATYYKFCSRCGVTYRYQEWEDGLHNFNDHLLLDLPLCLMIRNTLQANTTFGQIVESLKTNKGAAFPSADALLRGYLHFEALTDNQRQYSCVTYGNRPPIVVMELNNKAFHMERTFRADSRFKWTRRHGPLMESTERGKDRPRAGF
ncbi:hypothetical protein WMY93_007683 [Mugilogobius chulae]|uniref:HMG domain-containing protein n=1 Tax=Mugilogobius chulae TaxID=88201 RepID=A0AAW0PH26_9GOBI